MSGTAEKAGIVATGVAGMVIFGTLKGTIFTLGVVVAGVMSGMRVDWAGGG
jgi:hypothetical protein